MAATDDVQPSHPSEKVQRPIRSFVLRQGRLTAAQERAMRDLWPLFGVDWKGDAPLDMGMIFGRDAPVILEIGFGNGDSLAEMAERRPDLNWLGIDVHRPGIGHLLLSIEQRELSNLRLIRHDAVEVLTTGLRPGTLAGLQLFFPDPWPKRRHHKRRLLNADLLQRIARALEPGGVFHAATDWEPYAHQMLSLLDDADTLFENLAGPHRFSPRPASRPLTRFEQRGERLGHRVFDLMFRRR